MKTKFIKAKIIYIVTTLLIAGMCFIIISPEMTLARNGQDKASNNGGPGEDSDAPDWAGPNPTSENPHQQGGGKPGSAGDKKGDLYGDMVAIARYDDGTPIMVKYVDGFLVVNADGIPINGEYVQPIDADGEWIPLDNEGEIAPENEPLLVEVELERLSLGRSPEKVLKAALNEVYGAIQNADSISQDFAGRLILTTGDEVKTIDSPRDNLALYVELMEPGKLTGTPLDMSKLPQSKIDDKTLMASLYAAASSKTSQITINTVEYLNLILGVDGIVSLLGDDGKTYYDYQNFVYDRETTYGQMISVGTILTQDDTTIVEWSEPQKFHVLLFGSEPYYNSNAWGFAQAADDARRAILFVHDTYLIKWE